MIFRKSYNNHLASNPYLSSIHEKSATNIQKSYSTALPHWTLRFVRGIFLAALGYATRKHKGKFIERYVNDPSDLLLGPIDSGALNSHIYRQDPVTIPSVHYQSVLQLIWHRAYNIRLNHPEEDIIIYKDDLASAFRRLRYHPDVLAAYNFFLGTYLAIPVGMVFGSRDPPSLCCLLSKRRPFASQFVQRLSISHPTTSMINQVRYSHAPTSSRDINPAHKYPMNQGVDGTDMGPHPTFINDTIMAEFRSLIFSGS